MSTQIGEMAEIIEAFQKMYVLINVLSSNLTLMEKSRVAPLKAILV